jgi:hypothetical protein
MESNVEPDGTGKRKQTFLPSAMGESDVCVCRSAVFNVFFRRSIKPDLQSTKGLAANTASP